MDEIRFAMMIGSVVGLGYGLRVAGGRLAPKMALAPMLFLLTRWPVLITWVLGAGGMFALIASSAAANGKHPDMVVMGAISALCGLGVSALTVGPGFMIARMFAEKPLFALDDGETVESRRRGNHMLGNEARGGEILLTDRRLGFQPHRFNVQLDPWSVPFEAIHDVRTEGARLLLLDTEQGEEILVSEAPAQLAERIRAATGARTVPARTG